MNKEEFINKKIEDFMSTFFVSKITNEVESFLRQSLEEAWERGAVHEIIKLEDQGFLQRKKV